MRLFTALDLPTDAIAKLEDLLSRLRPTARIRWSPPANLHITTRFIGEWPEARLDELTTKLSELPARDPIHVNIRGLGFFGAPGKSLAAAHISDRSHDRQGVVAGKRAPSRGHSMTPKSPRIFWCGVEAAGLQELAADTDAATAALGIASEKSVYSPHLTLARIKDRLDLTALHDAIAAEATLEFGSFQAGSFFLYQSQLKPSGSVYTKLAEFPFPHTKARPGCS